jgi:hypothetical protein
MALEDYLVPVAFFAMIVLIVYFTTRARNERRRLEISGGGDFRGLAEDSVKAQQALTDEIRAMNATLKEIERLLSEV